MHRREFVSLLTGLLPTSAAFGASVAGTSADPPDIVVLNANVVTVDATRFSAQAFAIRDGRFVAVGLNSEIAALRGNSTQVVDVGGKTVVPGFNDVHLHPRTIFERDSLYYTPWLGPDVAPTMEQLVEILRLKAAVTPPGKLVSGYGYDDVVLKRHPTRHDLDQASTVHPISITHTSGHITVVNTYVLQASGLGPQTPDPPGGAFDRDPDGTPNGVVRESARAAIASAVGPAHQVQIPPAERIKGLRNCFRAYAAKGLTSVGIAGGSPEFLVEIKAVRDAGIPVRIGFMCQQSSFEQFMQTGARQGLGDTQLRLTAMKTFQGNSLSGRTCWLRDAYSDRPGYFGIPPARSQADLDRDFRTMHDAGWQIATHSNGDREIDMVLTAIERAQAANPRPDARHRVEHASVMNPELLSRAQAASVILVFHSYMWEHGEALASYGTERLQYMHAYRTAIDSGIHVAGHSDSPISAADPMLRIGDMVTRKSSHGIVYGAGQRVTIQEAIKVWTLDGAFATFEEDVKGSITPGKLADFVVLGADPRSVAPDDIKHVAIWQTYVGGKRVYDAAEAKTVAFDPPLVSWPHSSCCIPN
ncbi:MAG: amidohydrolase [Candidatus Eremiobacteraeota bacterium]|nr:amidohydrolase [Candidatus Eremiobacteraeota bacterium]